MAAPIQRPEREETAIREVGQTAVSPTLARCIALVFCLTLVSIPLVQCGIEWIQFRKGLADSPGPHAVSILSAIPRSMMNAVSHKGSAWEKLFSGNRQLIEEMERYETQLEEDSFLTRNFLGPVQSLLTRTLQAGNEQAYPGKDHWLFFRPDIDYVTQSGFDVFSGAQLPAILDFHEQLRERGITLVLMPTPVKPSIHPEFFSGAFSTASAPQHNDSYQAFLHELERHGVQVFDPTHVLADRTSPRYLETDTHWTFDAMEAVAEQASIYIQSSIDLPAGRQAFTRTDVAVTNLGDIASMLKLPAGSDLYVPQVQSLRQVLTSQNELWKPDPQAEVLLLGDSFSNIFSLEGMGWGESAGFAEQLSFHLKRPVDAILQNDAGAHATRQKLSSELARGRDRLDGKKVVLWHFAVRELTHGIWPSLPLTLGAPRKSAFYVPDPDTRIASSPCMWWIWRCRDSRSCRKRSSTPGACVPTT
jgi:alginate O-acetyltransferase complex protein AlgJ